MRILWVFETDVLIIFLQGLVCYVKRLKIVFLRFILTIYDMEIPVVTRNYMWLQGVTMGYRGLQGVTMGDRALQGVTREYRGVQRIIETFSN